MTFDDPKRKELFEESLSGDFDDSIKAALEGMRRILNDCAVMTLSGQKYYLLSEVKRMDLITFRKDIKKHFNN